MGGRTIVKDGRVVGIDYPALREELLSWFRADIGKNAGLAAALKEMETVVAANFAGDAPCC